MLTGTSKANLKQKKDYTNFLKRMDRYSIWLGFGKWFT
jgi:hypothetical protein